MRVSSSTFRDKSPVGVFIRCFNSFLLPFTILRSLPSSIPAIAPSPMQSATGSLVVNGLLFIILLAITLWLVAKLMVLFSNRAHFLTAPMLVLVTFIQQNATSAYGIVGSAVAIAVLLGIVAKISISATTNKDSK